MPYVNVDVELCDFELDDLIEYIERKGYTVSDSDGHFSEPNEELRLIWEAMYLGKPYDAMVRKFVSDHTGRFL
jgi:hypothetical protein